MRRYNLPPLDLLEAFEAAARHLSFTRAADELSLTQSAISRQIKTLEERLGVALFTRLHRALKLTSAGDELHRVAGGALHQLHDITEQLRLEQRQKTVVLTTTPGFAGLWLIPRLSGFTAHRPDVDVRISATYSLINLERDGVDLAIRYCAPANESAATGRKLFAEVVLPACSPALRDDSSRPLRHPQDLRHHVLLYGESTAYVDWPLWLRALKLEDLKPAGMLHFSQYDQMINAALAGQGVVLGRLPLISGLLEAGKLITPFAQTVPSAHAYHLIRSTASTGKPEVQEFSDWLMGEAEQATRAGAPDSSVRVDRARA